jgi:hypothetical protein
VTTATARIIAVDGLPTARYLLDVTPRYAVAPGYFMRQGGVPLPAVTFALFEIVNLAHLGFLGHPTTTMREN